MTSSDDYQGRFKALQAAEDAKDVLINVSKLEDQITLPLIRLTEW